MLYRALINVNIPPPVADEMELWQIASLMGDSDGGSGAAATGSPTMPGAPLSGEALLAARARAAREGRELDPEAMVAPVGAGTVASFQQSAAAERVGGGATMPPGPSLPGEA